MANKTVQLFADYQRDIGFGNENGTGQFKSIINSKYISRYFEKMATPFESALLQTNISKETYFDSPLFLYFFVKSGLLVYTPRVIRRHRVNYGICNLSCCYRTILLGRSLISFAGLECKTDNSTRPFANTTATRVMDMMRTPGSQ